MPEIDLTITISVIVALCAIVSPIFTSIINNSHQTKIKKLELKQQEFKDTVIRERNIYENYLRYAGRCIYFADNDALKDYGEYYLAALMYAPEDLQSDMVSVNKYMEKYDWPKALESIEVLTPKIHAILHSK